MLRTLFSTCAVGSLVLGVLAAGCAGAPVPRSDVARSTEPDDASDDEGIRIDGIVVHAGPLGDDERAYLDRLAHALQTYDGLPHAPATYAADADAWSRWSFDVLRPALAPLEAETTRLVREHPRATVETAETRRFHVLLELIELTHAARFYAETAGGPPSSAACPHDPPSQLAFLLTRIVEHAEVCVASLDLAAGGPLAETLRACEERRAWAVGLLARATPAAPDECMEDMPSPGE